MDQRTINWQHFAAVHEKWIELRTGKRRPWYRQQLTLLRWRVKAKLLSVRWRLTRA